MLWSAGTVAAQGPVRPVDDLVRRLASITAVTGLEQRMVDTLLAMLPGAKRDRAGNAVLTIGSGPRRRLVVCPADEPGYVVGRIRDDGWLTLRRSPGRISRLRDAQLEGQRVTIVTPQGVVPGVVAVRSVHLTRGREPRTGGFTVDSALVDVGATTRAEVEALGVRILAPVTLAKGLHRYGDRLVAGPMMGRRAACAALVEAARRRDSARATLSRRQAVVIAFVVEHELGQRGLATLARTVGPFDQTLLVADGGSGADAASNWPELGTVAIRGLVSRYAGTPVETISLPAVQGLADTLAAWIGGTR